MMRTFLQGWRAILQGSAEMDVYEDVTALGPLTGGFARI